MIDLTPLEVRKKSGDFRRAMRGYEPQAVDDFLDLVADRLEALVRENAALQARVSSIETQVSDYRERERALTEALVTAQEMREQMRRQMEREVELKRREAEAEAEAIRTDAAKMREREEENMRRLRARQTQFVQSYRAFLERELAELAVMTEALDFSKMEASAPAAKKRPRRAEAAEPPAAPPPEPQPMPLPLAVAVPTPEPEPEPAPEPELQAEPELTASLDDFADEDFFEPAPPFEREPVEPEADHGLIDLNMHFPPAEPPAAVAPEAASPLPAPAVPTPAVPPVAAEPMPLQAQIDFSNQPFGDEDMPELELIDEVDEEDDDDDDASDGWVSTLLEGKGD